MDSRLFRDHLGREINLRGFPKRIVSLVPSISEALVALGRPPVGLTKFCPEVEGAKVVGGTKQLYVDRVEALQPDLILANKEENSSEIVKSLEHLAPVFVTEIRTLEDNQRLLEKLGIMLGCEQTATRESLLLEPAILGFKPRWPIPVAYLIWREPWMVAGGDTFINEMLGRAGLENVFSDQDRYPELTLEALSESRAELLLLSSEPFPFAQKHINKLKAATGKDSLLVDGTWFSWYGTRVSRIWPDLEQWREKLEADLESGVET